VEREVIHEVQVPVQSSAEPRVVEIVPPAPPAAPPVDSDRDGVGDASDRCPNTLTGARVDATGCITEAQVLALPNINFRPGSTELTEDSKVRLGEAVSFLRDQPNLTV